MNDYYKNIFFQVLIMEVLCMVIGKMGSGCGRFGEGRKKQLAGCQELLFAHVKCLKSVCHPYRLARQNY